jgi:hypothetical protein
MSKPPGWVDQIKRAKQKPISTADREHIALKLPEMIETAEKHIAHFQREAEHARHWLQRVQRGDPMTVAQMEADFKDPNFPGVGGGGEIHWKLSKHPERSPWLPSLLAAWKTEKAHWDALRADTQGWAERKAREAREAAEIAILQRELERRIREAKVEQVKLDAGLKVDGLQVERTKLQGKVKSREGIIQEQRAFWGDAYKEPPAPPAEEKAS